MKYDGPFEFKKSQRDYGISSVMHRRCAPLLKLWKGCKPFFYLKPITIIFQSTTVIFQKIAITQERNGKNHRRNLHFWRDNCAFQAEKWLINVIGEMPTMKKYVFFCGMPSAIMRDRDFLFNWIKNLGLTITLIILNRLEIN